MKRIIPFINIFYILAFFFIYLGNQLITGDIENNVFFAIWELLYLPIVFGLPILSIFLLWKCYHINPKSFNVYLCMGLAVLTLVLFGLKLYFGIVEEILIF